MKNCSFKSLKLVAIATACNNNDFICKENISQCIRLSPPAEKNIDINYMYRSKYNTTHLQSGLR